jgi:dUTP pyrophosphatase
MMRYLLMYTVYLPYNLKIWFKKLFRLKNTKITDSYKHQTYYFSFPKKEKQAPQINIKCPYVPERKTEGAAAYDLVAKLTSSCLIFKAGETMLVPTGCHIEIPKGKCGLLLIRSSLSLNSPLGLANGVGLIDSDYRGEIKVPLRNYSASKRYTINNEDRIAQLLLIDCFTPELIRTKTLTETTRNDGSFGSTGTK